MEKLLDGNHLNKQQQTVFKLISAIALATAIFTVWVLYYDADLGLNLIWNFFIPLAPMLFLVVPNFWTSICPLAILQSLPKRLGFNQDKYLKKRETFILNIIGIIILYLLVPARHFIFNIEGEISFIMLVSLLFLAMLFGLRYTGLSGWCMGLCPIRPVELMYGQFSLEQNRPEVCTTCDLCVSNCSRLHVGENEKIVKYNEPFRYFIYSFPGFIFGYFTISPEEWWYLVYAQVYTYALISFVIFYILERLKFKNNELIYVSGILSISTYYVYVIPAVVKAWYIPVNLQAVFYIAPFMAILYSVMKILPISFRLKFVSTMAAMLFMMFTTSAFIDNNSKQLNHLNWQDFAYKTGNLSCTPCHQDLTESFHKSEMGRSYDPMSANFTDFDISESQIYDQKSDFSYRIDQKPDGLFYMKEWRVDPVTKDTTHQLEFKVDHVIGSGANTRSFIFRKNGFMFEMPLTWYSEKKKWDLSPGYQNYNMRFFRVTNQRCIDCHTKETTFEDNSDHRYFNVEFGIDCEKCHGPASLHIEKQEGLISLAFDPIENPLYDDKDKTVCYDCHPKNETPFLDANTKDIQFTAHSTRLALSKCFTMGDIKCITCHDPHLELEQTKSKINNSCFTCHENKDIKKIVNHADYKECVSCHMPSTGSRDIPHVSPTEHWIKVYDKSSDKYYETLNKSYLDYIVPESISKWEKKEARKLLQSYQESIGTSRDRTDTLYLAERLLSRQIIQSPEDKYVLAKIKFFKKNYKQALELFESLEFTDQEYFEPDVEYYYFYAKTLYDLKRDSEAEKYFEKGLKIYPNHIPTFMTLSSMYIDRKNYEQAKLYCEKILSLNPYYRDALYQVAFIIQSMNIRAEEAIKAYRSLIDYYPDDHSGSVNLSILEFNTGVKTDAINRLTRLTGVYPESNQIKANLARFLIIEGESEAAKVYVEQIKQNNPNSAYLKALNQLLN